LCQVYAAIFVCLGFSGGIPLMLPILFITTTLTFWVDKALFIYFYDTPPQYDSALARAFTDALPYCVLIHLVLAIWMLSQGNIFPSAATATAAIAQWQSASSSGSFLTSAQASLLSTGVEGAVNTGSLNLVARATTPQVGGALR
jgi:hypothetical protein